MKPWKRLPVGQKPKSIRRFNGATAMKPWKRRKTVLGVQVAAQLQWGHGDEAVEEQGNNANIQTFCNASMGPRR